ncbi:MAG: SMP-30/gluconolactonase/LRE family protein [Fimbriimonas sp.]
MPVLLIATLVLGSMPTDSIVPAGAKVEKVVGGFLFTEGAIWTRKNTLIFSDIPANLMVELTGTSWKTFRKPSDNANGNQLDASGNLYTAHHGSRSVTFTDMKTGDVKTLAAKFAGSRLNSPNDLVVDSKGIVYFTDPDYGVSKDKKELDFNGVYRITLGGRVEALIRDFKKPNGIGLSPDEKTLYVADTEANHVRSFTVTPDGRLLNPKVFYSWTSPGAPTGPGAPDGLRLDKQGNVYATGPGGVSIIRPDGTLIASIPVPEVPTNVAWGEADGKTLYITAQTSIYRIKLNATGLRY